MLWELLSLVLLLIFLGINVMSWFIRIGGKLAGVTLRKALRVDVPRNEKKGLERLFTLIWVAIGLWASFKVRWNYLAMLFAFLAFRSGANITRTLVYSIHDGKVLEKYAGDSRALSLLSRAVRASLLLEGLFVFAFGLAYKAISMTARPGEFSRGLFILELWLAGLVFGALFGWLIARNNRGILLENQIVVVYFFAGKKGREKVNEFGRKVKLRG
ncbi:hypothetical protein A3L08_02635 [Thermococcus pacificus]|uniref:Uncharacterized protein n=1 Tax=Thermococcus pacificus TaxID=71998 RepID=A0A218P6A3_9EURY|nr:hypothetical protein A3L08_02635 [Thermococcus pacificus]